MRKAAELALGGVEQPLGFLDGKIPEARYVCLLERLHGAPCVVGRDLLVPPRRIECCLQDRQYSVRAGLSAANGTRLGLVFGRDAELLGLAGLSP